MGLQVIAIIPPSIPRIEPMKKPPPPIRLKAEKTRITVPQAAFWWDCELSITAPTRTMIPVIMPTIAES